MKQVEPKAMAPLHFFVGAPWRPEPLSKGAIIRRDTLIGFLHAASEIFSNEYPVARLELDPSMKKSYLQAKSGNVWCLSAMNSEFSSQDNIAVGLPIVSAVSMLNAETGDSVTVGLNDGALCIGTRCMEPKVSLADIYPPVLEDYEARSVVPAFYFEEILSRVHCATTPNCLSSWGSAVLLDFEYAEIDGGARLLCTAVGIGGERMHILKLPQIRTEMRSKVIHAIPPTVVVPTGFFRYVRRVANRQWVGMDMCGTKLVARGEDFACVADASIEVRDGERPLVNWRDRDVEHECEWLVDCSSFAQAVDNINSPECQISIAYPGEMVVGDGISRTQITMQPSAGSRRSIGHVFKATFDASHLYYSIEACRGGIIRIGVGESANDPLTLRGEDEQFKAVIYPAGMDIK